MREIEFIPACFKDEKTGEEAMSGKLKVRIATVDERFGYSQSLGLQIAENGEMDLTKVEEDRLGFIKKLVKIGRDHVTSVDVTTKAGETFKSVEDLDYGSESTLILRDVGTAVLNGFKPSKK